MSDVFFLRNVLSSHQERDRTRPPTDSNRFPGHEQRMAWHMMQVRNHPCPCGSGVRFVDCCLGKCRCKSCGRTYLSPDSGPGFCPACGSDHVVTMPLKEVCG
jgi:hypothetical protein